MSNNVNKCSTSLLQSHVFGLITYTFFIDMVNKNRHRSYLFKICSFLFLFSAVSSITSFLKRFSLDFVSLHSFYREYLTIFILSTTTWFPSIPQFSKKLNLFFSFQFFFVFIILISLLKNTYFLVSYL